jgi:tRNA(adenine34) deaminase
MCSFPIRETRISRVIFSIQSRLMGGASRWNVLGDSSLSDRMPDYFGRPPEIVAGVLRDEAEAVWEVWNPEIWRVFRKQGLFGAAP